jgi:hypothetical protein
MEAVELGAFRYLLKPVEGAALDQALRLATSLSKRDSHVAAARSASRSALLRGMSGAFGVEGAVGLLDVIHLLASTHKTGNLEVTTDGESAIRFSDGAVVDARLGARSGEDAFFAIVRSARGTFKFEPMTEEDAESEWTIERSTDALLLEAMGRGDAARAPATARSPR